LFGRVFVAGEQYSEPKDLALLARTLAANESHICNKQGARESQYGEF
jgi:hypothetical protein